MSEHAEMVGLEDVPDWSCGGYVYDDVIGLEFGTEERDGVMYPYVKDPGPLKLTDDMPIARLRFIRREDCPVHGQGELEGTHG